MIGSWRLLLALLVVCAHLFNPWWPGAMAVFSFYTISGFLMTLILHEQYSFSGGGLRAFWLNRFLRIYPPYYFACAVSLVLLLVFGADAVAAINPHLSVPDTPGEISTNLLIFGLLDWPEDRAALVVPGWTLFIELVHYLLISLWAGRSRRTAYVFLALAVAYLVGVYAFLGGNFGFRYLIPPAGSFPFAMGVVLYFHKDALARGVALVGWGSAFAAAVLLYAAVFVAAAGVADPLGALLYLNVCTSALLLGVLWHAPATRFANLDKLLGDLSYPTYLLHWQAGVLVVLVTGLAMKSVAAFALSIGLVLLCALFERRFVSGPLERLRRAVKRSRGRVSSGVSEPAGGAREPAG
jgi:peptidoglycan/LPS O-acetylase OafA/YrhL